MVLNILALLAVSVCAVAVRAQDPPQFVVSVEHGIYTTAVDISYSVAVQRAAPFAASDYVVQLKRMGWFWPWRSQLQAPFPTESRDGNARERTGVFTAEQIGRLYSGEYEVRVVGTRGKNRPRWSSDSFRIIALQPVSKHLTGSELSVGVAQGKVQVLFDAPKPLARLRCVAFTAHSGVRIHSQAIESNQLVTFEYAQTDSIVVEVRRYMWHRLWYYVIARETAMVPDPAALDEEMPYGDGNVGGGGDVSDGGDVSGGGNGDAGRDGGDGDVGRGGGDGDAGDDESMVGDEDASRGGDVGGDESTVGEAMYSHSYPNYRQDTGDAPALQRATGQTWAQLDDGAAGGILPDASPVAPRSRNRNIQRYTWKSRKAKKRRRRSTSNKVV